MQTKICIKLPQIKNEISLKDQNPGALPIRIKNVKKGKKKELSYKKSEIFQSLNNLRLISLTPDIVNDKKHYIRITNSPKLTEKPSSPTPYSRNSNKRPSHLHTGNRSRGSPLMLDNDTSPISIPGQLQCLNIRRFLFELPDKNKINQDFEYKRRASFITPTPNKSMIHYYKF
jgi:hypothetical protein